VEQEFWVLTANQRMMRPEVSELDRSILVKPEVTELHENLNNMSRHISVQTDI